MSEATKTIHLLSAWRTANDWKQGPMAELLGVTGSHLSQIETGRKSASLPLAIKINRFTKGAVPVESLVKTGERA